MSLPACSRERHDQNAADLDILARGRTLDWTRREREDSLYAEDSRRAQQHAKEKAAAGIGTRASAAAHAPA